MATNEELLDTIKDLCYQFGGWSDGGLTHDFISALEGAFDILGWDSPHPVPEMTCDEDGCNKQITCGWPSDSGYRRTCSEHKK